MKVDVKGLKALTEKLDNLEDKLNNDTELFELIGVAWVGQIKQSFQKSIDPYGKKWKSVDRNGRPLLDTGLLVGDINYIATKNSVTVGTPLIYSDRHNKGLKGVTKRQFIPLKTDSNFNESNLYKTAFDIINKYYKEDL